MSAVIAPAPWAAIDLDLDRALAELRRRFPNAVIWFGEFTGHFWALTSRRGAMIEAVNPADLGRHLAAAQQRHIPRYARAEIIASRFARGPQTGAAGRPISVPRTLNGHSRPAAPLTTEHGRHERPRRLRRLLDFLFLTRRRGWSC